MFSHGDTPNRCFFRYIPDRWASVHINLCPAAPPPPPPCFNVAVPHTDLLRSFSHLSTILCRCSSYKTISFTSRVCFSAEIRPGVLYTASPPTQVFSCYIYTQMGLFPYN